MPEFPAEFPLEELQELVSIIKNNELVDRRNEVIKLACWILGSAVEMIEPSYVVGSLGSLSPADAVVAEFQQASESSEASVAGFSISPSLIRAIKALLCSL